MDEPLEIHELEQRTPGSLVAVEPFVAGDFNGDDRPDVATLSPDGRWSVGLNTGARLDWQQWGRWPGSFAQVGTADFDGDGDTDVHALRRDGAWIVGLSNGRWFSPGRWAGASTSTRLVVGDWNDDGRDDVAGLTNGVWRWGISHGRGIDVHLPPSGWQPPAPADVAWGDWQRDGWRLAALADLDGDGSTDAAYVRAGVWAYETADGFRSLSWAAPDEPPTPPRADDHGRYPDWSLYQYDASGVILAQRGPATYYNAEVVSLYVRGLYDQWHDGDATVFDALRVNADWLRDHQTYQHGLYVYTYPFAHPTFLVPAGWTSGMAAGDAVAALYAASLALGDDGYRDAAERLLPAFQRSWRQGGYLTSVGPGAAWYEELAHPSASRTTLVLNGHMYAVMALAWYAQQTGSERAASIVEAGLRGLERLLPRYDLPGGWSQYDLFHRGRVNCFYHRKHAHQLHALYALTGRDIYRRYAERWAANQCSGIKVVGGA